MQITHILHNKKPNISTRGTIMSLFKPYYKEVNTMHVGCEAPRAYFIPFESRESALSENRAHSEYFYQLSGEWDFRFFKNPDEKISSQKLMEKLWGKSKSENPKKEEHQSTLYSYISQIKKIIENLDIGLNIQRSGKGFYTFSFD